MPYVQLSNINYVLPSQANKILKILIKTAGFSLVPKLCCGEIQYCYIVSVTSSNSGTYKISVTSSNSGTTGRCVFFNDMNPYVMRSKLNQNKIPNSVEYCEDSIVHNKMISLSQLLLQSFNFINVRAVINALHTCFAHMFIHVYEWIRCYIHSRG